MAARPATRNRPAPPAEARPRPPVRDFTGGAGFSIEWDVRPVYDFLFALSGDAGSTDDLPAADRAWLTDARASLPEDLRASVGRLFESELAIHVASFAVERPEIRTARQFVAALDVAGQAETMRSVVCDALHEPGLAEAIDRMAAGDATAISDI